MRTIVLDDRGHAWDACSSALRKCFLHYPVTEFDFLSYLINNMGFVTVALFRPGSAQIRIRFETATPVSVAAAINLVSDLGVERMVISNSVDLADKLFSTRSQAVTYINQRLGEPCQRAATNIRYRQMPIETLVGCQGPLSMLLSYWDCSDRTADLTALKKALCSPAAVRFAAIEAVAGRLTIIDLGAGFEIFSKTWRENAPGIPVDEQPDYEYGRWVHRMYESVLETHQPRLDEVDAKILRPHLNDKVQLSYQRLIVPFKYGRRGVTRLIGASLVRQSIKLSSES
ncbi:MULTISPECIES: hypothetical protein [Bradyrhizobium]|uniref:Uncharacterized protein n=3 Tax=Bradyrhizobium TaxID=374 RepID=A0A9X1RKI7_9BRAD|nr:MULTISPECIES: hypothetical protein [Bradyrhizobium]MCG2632783.1 hypothetical protein [Bradyrhizobium zhengyangense]MCG2645438.1 hypothetical protein [Bradyrhizobium zhengyangense]MCG2672876.1 hypothetical protein [Bradyrhizobium zhengyangense]MDN4985469.1 hypothetical protein [Bradyrhizobium sp. WYCCWR 13022]MDN5006233.1 hypothetical protein [Bradyrhizobium sp. WYCCWR 12677]